MRVSAVFEHAENAEMQALRKVAELVPDGVIVDAKYERLDARTTLMFGDGGRPPVGIEGDRLERAKAATAFFADHAVAYAVILRPELRDRLARELPPVDDAADASESLELRFARSMVKVKWAGLWLDLGEAPHSGGVLQMTDADAAKQAVELVAAARAERQEQLDEASALLDAFDVRQEADRIVVAGDMKKLGAIVSDAIRPLGPTKEQMQRRELVSNLRQVTQAIFLYAAEHDGKLPPDLDALKAVLGDEAEFNALMTHPVTGERPAFQYIKPKGDDLFELENTGEIVLLRELRNGRVHPGGMRGFADGHIEMTSPTDEP